MIEDKIKEYQTALETYQRLSKQETALRPKVVAARFHLSLIKNELRDLELDITQELHAKTV